MTVSTLANSTTAAAAAATTSTASSASSNNQISSDTFLQLLMTQLQNQNPLNPMDPTEFTSQLVSYSSLEQQISTNSKLDALTSQLSSLSAQSSISFLGTTAELNSNISAMQSGQATWSYDLGNAAKQVNLTVTDADGNTVYSGTGDADAGNHTLSLSSSQLSKAVADGAPLTLSVSAVDATGAAVSTTIHSFAVIDGLQGTSSGMTYQSGDITFSDADIVGVHRTN